MVTNTNGFRSLCIQGDEANIQEMLVTPDWVQFALDREVVKEPGEEFCYDSPGMHLLSAVLQQATGMTEHEFARKYLFEPLGIHESVWNSEPRGYNRGWGDLHLKPADAAKIGFLFLHNGMWEGQQIVPADWVEEAVKPQIQVDDEESYGYGWWVEEGQFSASGRGGQKIFILPALDVVLVSAGGGFEYSEIDPYISGSVVDLENPLPANPDGMAQLKAALEAIKQPQSPFPAGVQPDPDLVKSGQVYSFPSNPFLVEKLSLNFDDPAEPIIHIEATTGEQFNWAVGMDGKYRLSEDGRGVRGYWLDPQTFVFESFDVGNIRYQAHFKVDSVVLESPDLGLSAEGQLENP